MHKIVKAETRNNSIDMFRLLCACLVVAIHTSLLKEFYPNISFFITQVVARIAVPFFFCIAGYFYFKSLQKNDNVFLKYIKKILFIYIFWSIMHFLVGFSRGILLKNSLSEFSMTFIKNFFLGGFIPAGGFAYHFWFFPALIFTVILFTGFYKLGIAKLFIALSVIVHILLRFGRIYLNLFTYSQIIGTIFSFFYSGFFIGISFFGAGCLTSILREKFNKLSKKSLFTTILVIFIIYSAEIFATLKLKIGYADIVPISGYLFLPIIVMLLLNNPLPNLKNVGSCCRVLSNFTYYSHLLFIAAFGFICDILKIEGSCTTRFTFVIICCCGFGFIIYKLNIKWLNKIVM